MKYGLPIFVIRYNPDAYLNKSGEVSRISDRQRELIRVVKKAMNQPAIDISEYIRVIYLFYDGYEISSTALVFLYRQDFFDCKITDSPKRGHKRKLDISSSTIAC